MRKKRILDDEWWRPKRVITDLEKRLRVLTHIIINVVFIKIDIRVLLHIQKHLQKNKRKLLLNLLDLNFKIFTLFGKKG
ncbi:hypothetical protein [Campylobacter concisus]|jgi:hypothetical protein